MIPATSCVPSVGRFPSGPEDLIVGMSIVVDDKPNHTQDSMNLPAYQHAQPDRLNVSYIKLEDTTVRSNSSRSLNSTVFTDIVYNPYAGLDWHQEMHLWWFAINQVFKW
jgi:hypothetical protein